jgi:hypothetical protein
MFPHSLYPLSLFPNSLFPGAIGGVTPALLITQSLTCIQLTPAPAPDIWTIDPERTIFLSTSPAPSPWTIDPERTIQL